MKIGILKNIHQHRCTNLNLWKMKISHIVIVLLLLSFQCGSRIKKLLHGCKPCEEELKSWE